MKTKTILVPLLLFLATPHAWGARQTQPSGKVELVIRGGFLFDAETGSRHPLGQLWIGGGEVLGEKALDAELPDDAKLLDATGMTVLPGLFDLHCHVGVGGGPMDRRLAIPPERDLAGDLYCGITSVVDLHGDEGRIFALRRRSREDPGLARLYVAGAAFTAPGGHGTQFGVSANTVRTVEEVDQRFALLLAKHPDVIKGILEHGGWAGLPKMPTLSPELLSALGSRAREAGLPFFCHVWSLDEAFTATRCGATALAHGVFLGEVNQELVAAMKESGTAYVPTLAVVVGALQASAGASPYAHELARGALRADLYAALDDPELSEDPGATWAHSFAGAGEARALANLRRIHAAGIPIGLGTDAGNPLTPHGPAAIHELELLVRAGLQPAEALQCATIQSARILGVADRYGSLRVGKVADVVLVAGDPTADIARMWEVEAVLKGGVVVDRAAIRKANQEFSPASGRRLVVGKDLREGIDGFEDGDRISDWGGEWQILTDSVAGGKSLGELENRVEKGRGSLALVGSVKEGFQWGAWSGMILDWSGGGARVVDASAYTGIRMRVRGSERPYTFTVHRAAVKDYDFFTAPLAVGREWREIDIPFSSLKQVGFGKAIPWAADDLTGLSVDARNNPFTGQSVYGDFELEVDWVRLYR